MTSEADMKISTLMALASPVISVVLAACGGGSGGSSATAAAPAGSAPASASAPATASAPSTAASAPSATVPQSTTPNTQPVTVASALTTTRNMLRTSVTVCVPGTSTCQTIDNIQVDTGSQGLRILASALNSSIALPNVPAGSSGAIAAQCSVFGSGYTWGTVRQADVRMAGQLAGATSVQLIADPAAGSAATDCSQSGLPMLTAVSLRSNGILGVGPFKADCGAGCASSALPDWYYSCSNGTCTNSTLAVAQQVTNPIANFATDNNGVLIELPAIPDAGASSVTGTMIFGIGSQANNALGSATVLQSNGSTGYVSTSFGGGQFSSSFIDSGSNGLFFPSSTLTKCGVWYCPSSEQTFNATISSTSGASAAVTFNVGTSSALLASPNYAFNNLAGTASGVFDWGLSFFYGRRVFTAIDGRVTPAGNGPYYAF
jgi:hypothetical protein